MSRSLILPMLLAVGSFGGITVAPTTPVAAADQDGVLAHLYGQGVHAYFGHDLSRAIDLFDQAIAAGSLDPRAHYYRGLSAAGLGRSDEAKGDFQEGARLEARGDYGTSIGRALTRIQGVSRMQIETARNQARLDYHVERASQDDARYSEPGAREDEMLRQPPTPRQPPAIPGYQPLTPFADEPTPFDDPAEPAQPTVQARDAMEAVQPADPFTDDTSPTAPTPAAPPAADDPFGGDTPMDDPFGAPAAGDDPFGAPPAAGDDPFG